MYIVAEFIEHRSRLLEHSGDYLRRLRSVRANLGLEASRSQRFDILQAAPCIVRMFVEEENIRFPRLIEKVEESSRLVLRSVDELLIEYREALCGMFALELQQLAALGGPVACGAGIAITLARRYVWFCFLDVRDLGD